MSRVLGLDCGKVIFDPLGGQMPGALKHIAAIAHSGRFDDVYLVSRANPLNRLYFPLRLRLIGFWSATGIPRSHLRFCFHNEEKARLCRELGITHFVDDRLDVLRRLDGVPHRFTLNPSAQDMRRFPDALAAATKAASWDELAPLLLSD